MNLKALITTLVLTGTSTAALAQPVASFSASASVRFGTRPASVRPTIRDHRTPTARPPVRRFPMVHAQAVFGDRAEQMYDYGHEPVAPTPVEPIYDGPIRLIVGGDGSSYNGALAAVTGGSSWTAITEGTRIEKGREFINLASAGPIRGLILQPLAGSTQISHVSIEFADHSVRVVTLDVNLTTRTGQIALPLDGQVGVNRIVVYGASSQGSAYRLLAR